MQCWITTQEKPHLHEVASSPWVKRQQLGDRRLLHLLLCQHCLTLGGVAFAQDPGKISAEGCFAVVSGICCDSVGGRTPIACLRGMPSRTAVIYQFGRLPIGRLAIALLFQSRC